MRSTISGLVLALGLFAAAPASAQTLLDKLLAKAVRPKAAAASGAPTPTGPAVPAVLSPAQQSALDRLLAAPLQDRRVAADRAEARPLIVRLRGIGACARRPSAWNAINGDSLTPGSYDQYDAYKVAMNGLAYHDQASCLDVARLTDWSKPALNALGFQAYYVAADSGEAKSQSFELQKNAEGVWMVRNVGRCV